MRKIITLFSVIFITKVYSQNNNVLSYYFKNFPNSPSTSAFLRYGDIQNSEFTGTNSPKIPLYAIQQGDITVPLTLDYISGNGIKTADEASSVGLGWNLGMPVIVQSILGNDDFSTTTNKLKIDLHYQPTTPWGLLNYNDQYLETKDGASEPAGYVQTPEIGKYTYYYSVYHNLPVNGSFHTYDNWLASDASPDVFSLYLFGEKIEFFISNHKDLNSAVPILTSLKKGYQIKFDNPTLTFNIIAPDGITYQFGRNEEVKILGNINRNFVLTKIIDKNQKSINITYTEYKDILNFIPQSKNLNYNRGYTSTFSPGCGGIPVYWGMQYVQAAKFRPPNLSADPYETQQAGHTYFAPNLPVFYSIQNYLLVSKISGDFGNVDFSYSNREDFPTGKLNTITVKNIANKTVKNIDFQYEYSVSDNNNFQNPNTNLFSIDRMKKRLFLKKLIINQTENYGFNYYDSQKLPRKDSYAVDYWGYSNGGINNQTYFPKPTDFSSGSINQLPITSLNNNIKTADINFTVSGLLKRITYPTQGYSAFTYESNTAANLFSAYYPSLMNTGKGVRLENQSNYDFNDILLEKTKFIYENGYSTNPLDLVKEFVNKKYSTSGGYDTYTIISFNSSNNYSASALSSGDYVGYEKVSKVQFDNSNNEKGRIISSYSINPDVFYHFWLDQLPVSIPTTKNSGIENGKLLSQVITNSNNEKIQETTNQYDTRYSKIYYGTLFSPISEYLYICKGWSNGGNASSGDPDPNSIRDISVVAHYPVFSKESLLSNVKTIEYVNGQELVTNTLQFYNNNNNLTNKTTTFPDGKYNGQDIKYSVEKNNAKLINANILNIPLETQTVNNINGITKTISLLETKYDDPVHLNPTSVISYNVQNNFPSTEAIYNLYDKGNLLQYTTKEGIPVTIIWGYNKTLPIAKIEGGSYSQVIQAFGLNVNDTTSYQLLDIVKKSDLDIDDASENSLISELDNFRTKPELKDFIITTYVYDPLIGVKAITRSSGIREFYKYNNTNKLEKVTDVNGKIIKEYKYNYAPTIHYNFAKEQPFTRNNCAPGMITTPYIYTVPANKYTSIIDQADAQQKAQNEIDTNGQNMANANGICYYPSCEFNSQASSSYIMMQYAPFQKANTVVNAQLNFQVTYNQSINWSNGVILGNIPSPCWPLTTITKSSGNWQVTLYPASGQTVLRWTGSGSPVIGTPYNVSFNYNVN